MGGMQHGAMDGGVAMPKEREVYRKEPWMAALLRLARLLSLPSLTRKGGYSKNNSF